MLNNGSIFINGAGLAGSACAIRLCQLGHSVVLIDQSKFPRAKLCGEFLGPDAMPLLKKLGLLETVLAQNPVMIPSVNLHNKEGKALQVKLSWIRADYPYALALPRINLDFLLLQHAQILGATVKEEHTVEAYSFDPARDQFEILVKSCHSVSTDDRLMHSSIFVEAAGRNSHILNRFRKDTESKKKISSRTLEPYVGVQSHVKLTDLPSDLNMYFFKGGYGGIQSIGSDTANICLWVKPEWAQASQKNFQGFLEMSIGQNIAAQKLIKSIQVLEPVKTVGGINALHQKREASQTIISIGDALLTVEPFSGFGMSHALHTGILAAEEIDQGIREGLSYQQILKRYLHAYQLKFRSQLLFLQWIHPFLNHPFLQTVSWPFLKPVLPLMSRLYR